MIKYVDIHSHGIVQEDKEIFSYPTLSVTDEGIYTYDQPFWCGLHPCESMNGNVLIERLEVVQEHLIGIGEIGLDANCVVENQKELFELQFDFARRKKLPITIHVVKAYNELVRTLRQKGGERVVIHSFISHPVVAQHLLDSGCYLSFGSSSLRSGKSVDALRRMPTDRLFIESDGKGDLKSVYEQIAKIKGLELEELKQIIYNNYTCLIG
ncbi:MAG: TatD family hydrolase [Rikenellaceae bacterium]